MITTIFDNLGDTARPTYMLDDNVRQIVEHISNNDFKAIERMDSLCAHSLGLSALANRLGLSVFKGGLFESNNRRLTVIALLANKIDTVAIDVDTQLVYNCLGTSWVGANCLPVSDPDILDLLNEVKGKTGVYFINAPVIDDFTIWADRDLAAYDGIVYDAIFEDDCVLIPGQCFIGNLATGACEIIGHDLRLRFGMCYHNLVRLLRKFSGYMIRIQRLDAADNVVLSIGGHVIALGNFNPTYCGNGYDVIDLAVLDYDLDDYDFVDSGDDVY